MSEKSGLRAIGYVEKCGHNFPPMECPYERCGYREAMARVAELEAAVQMWTEAHDFMNRKAAEALARVAAMEPK